MKKSIFAVCDLEESYACNLTEYLNERKNMPFEVQAFTNLESLAEFAGENHIDLLLISTDAMCEDVKNMDIDKIIILSEGEPLEYPREEPCVYKYQSSDSLLAEVMNYYAEASPIFQPVSLSAAGFHMKILGVYSPINRVGKTTFALTLGEILAEQQKVLYLNLEDFNGFESIFSREYRSDISDLIYFARQKEGNMIFRLNSMIQTLHNLDYIPPAFSPFDLRDVHYEEWIRFIQDIGACGEYEVIILDVGNQIEEVYQILMQCERIYMPVLEDDISRSKILQFEKNMTALECQELHSKICKLHLPEWEGLAEGRDLVEQLLCGKLGNFVRRLLKKEGE